MSDYISRADAIGAVHKYYQKRFTEDSKWDADAKMLVLEDKTIAKDNMEICNIINALPSADAVPQSEQYKKGFEDCKRAYEIELARSADAVQGEWIEKYNGNGWNDFWDYTCSNCGKKYERADAVLYHANYCPNCGARMKGGEDE